MTVLLPHSCRCGSRWSGLSTAHCAAASCHQTFTGPSAFSDHRRDGRCVPPAAAGMVLRERAGYEAWGFPADPDAVERFRALKERAA